MGFQFFRGVFRLRFPAFAQPANRLAHAHRQRGDGLQAQHGLLRQLDIAAPQLSSSALPEDSGQRIVQFVPQNLAKISCLLLAFHIILLHVPRCGPARGA